MPSRPNQILPEPLCLLSTQVSSGLEQWGFSSSHLTSKVHEHLRVPDPTLLVTVEPHCPETVLIEQPPLRHSHGLKHVYYS